MATTSPPPAGAPRLLHVELADIAPHPRNPRRDVGDVTELAASIAEVGLMEPLVIVHAATGGAQTYWILAGHRRHAAAQLAVLAEVPCLLREDLDTPDKHIAAMLVENLHRADLTPVEEGDAYQQLLTFPGYTVKRLATAVARSPGTVRTRVAIAKLPDPVKARIHDRQITLDEALALGEFAADPDAVVKLTRAVGTHDWKWTLQSLRDARAATARAAKQRKDLLAQGVRLIKSPRAGRLEIDGEAVDRWTRLLAHVLHNDWMSLTDEEAAAHAECPGHAAEDPTGRIDGTPVWLCLRPDLHEQAPDASAADEGDTDGETPAGVPSPVVDDAEEIAREEAWARQAAEQVAQQAACQAAYDVRRQWLAQFCSGTTPLTRAPADAITRYAVTALCTTLFGDDIPHLWIDLVAPFFEANDSTDEKESEQEALRLAAIRDPHRMLLAIASVDEERQMDRHGWWTSEYLRAHLPWFDLLVALGFQPCSWEQDRINAARDAARRAAPEDEQL